MKLTNCINSDDPNKTASDSEITVNSIVHHFSDSITSVENWNIKSCDCIIRRESLKDEFNLKVLVLKVENLKDEIPSIRKDVELTFDKNLIETINEHGGESENLNDKIKLLETENKILKDDITTKQKFIDSLLQHNNLSIIQQEGLTTELLTPTIENSCKSRNNDVKKRKIIFGRKKYPQNQGCLKPRNCL